MSCLPRRRPNNTYRVAIGGRTLHVTISRWPAGGPAEVFVDVQHREGGELRAVVQTLARTVSGELQAGAPLDKVLRQLRALAFEPAGPAEIGEEEGIHVRSPLDAVALCLEADAADAAGIEAASFWARVRAERGAA